MPNTSPGITIPGIPSAGAYGYANTSDQLIYDPASHAGGPPLPGGLVAQTQYLQNLQGNILAANVGNFENGLTSGFAAINGTIVNVATGPAHSGTHAVQYTGTGAGTVGWFYYGPGANGLAVPASYVGYQMSFSAWIFNPSAPPRTFWLSINWYNAGGAQIGQTLGTPITEVNNAWIPFPAATGIVPANTAFLMLIAGGTGMNTLNEVRYFDDFCVAPY